MSSPQNKFLATAEDTEHAFYDAIARADLDSLMALWADDEEIVCIHPGALRLDGHAAIRESWEMIFERGPVHIHPRNLHITQNMMSAVHSVIEEIKLSEETNFEEAHIIATNVYLKTPQGWRIVIHHASVAAGKASDHHHADGSVLH